MDFSSLLIVIGIIFIIISFFIGQKNVIDADEVEKISISLHQETHGLKKRIKLLEEELMMSMEPLPTSQEKSTNTGQIHEIIINQILSLNSQDFSVEDIAKRSSLSNEDVLRVLQSRGVM